VFRDGVEAAVNNDVKRTLKRDWLPRRRVLVLPFTANISAREEVAMSNVTALHDAVKRGDLDGCALFSTKTRA